jgi:hypothetical protein
VSAVSASHFASAQHCCRMVSQAVLLHCMQPSDLIFHPLPSRYSQSTNAVCCRAQKKALIKFHPDRYQSASVAVQVVFAPCLPFADRGDLMPHALPSCMAASCEAVTWSDAWCCCQTLWCRPSVTSYWTPASPCALALFQVEAEEIFKIISKVPLTDPKPVYTWVPRRW